MWRRRFRPGSRAEIEGSLPVRPSGTRKEADPGPEDRTAIRIAREFRFRASFRGQAVFETRSLRWGLCTVAALLPLSLLAGCQQPLAFHDPYFRPGNTTAAAHRAETRRVVRSHLALQTARQSCPGFASPGADRPDGPEPATKAGQEALAALCAGLRDPSRAAYGGTSNAYRRWVEDRVRKLPKAAATGAGAAGGG